MITFLFVFMLILIASHCCASQFWNGDVSVTTASPSWDFSDNYGDNCSYYRDEGSNTTTVFGNPSFLCSLQISTNLATSIKIPPNQAEEYLLFIDGTRSMEDCPAQIAAIYGYDDRLCSVSTPYAKLILNLLGNVSILISEVSARQLKDGKCLVSSDEMGPYDNQTMSNCDVRKYQAVRTCNNPGKSSCRLIFPRNCSAVLSYREVHLSCEVANNIFRERNLIVYSKAITALDITKNSIVEIRVGTLGHLTLLETLRVGFNQIKHLEPGVFKGLGSLKKLFLGHNDLVTLDYRVFIETRALLVLDISSNEFESLPGELFSSLTALKELYLNENKLQELKSNLFANLTKLEILYLDSNRLQALDQNVFRALISLKKLYLRNNLLQDLDTKLFQNLTALTHFFIGNNLLPTLDEGTFRGLANMNRLYINANQLTRLETQIFQDLKNVRALSLVGNRLENLQVGIFDGSTSLQFLLLSENSLITIPSGLLNDLHNLQTLSLHHNNLEYLPSNVLNGTSDLKSLYLDHNHLTHLQNALLTDLNQLEYLVVNDNYLKYIGYDLLQNTPNLAILDLSNNKLNTIPNLSGLDKLLVVNFKGNRLLDVGKRTFSSIKKTKFYLFAWQHEICECFVPFGVNCSASSVRSPFLTCDRLLSDRILVAIMWLIGINALGGKGFVLWYKSKHTKNKVQTILCNNLALSDFLMGLYMIIIAIADAYFGDTFPMRAENWRTGIICRLTGALSITSSEASVFFVTLISIDRFISVVHTRSRLKLGGKRTLVTVVLIWTFAISLGVIPSSLAGRNPNFYDNSHVCIGLPLALYESYTTHSVSKSFIHYRFFTVDISSSKPNGQKVGMYFSTTVFLGLNYLCYVVIVICYVSIIRTVYLSSKRAGLNSEMKTQIRLTLKVAAIVITDFICWFPIILLGIFVQSEVLTLPSSVFAWAVTFVMPINSAINPYLYTLADVISTRRKENQERSTDGSSQSRTRTGQNVTRTTFFKASSHSVSVTHSGAVLSGPEVTEQQNSPALPNVPDYQGSESNV